jgi:hypothetical protein
VVNGACVVGLIAAATVVISALVAPAGAFAAPLCTGDNLQVRAAGGQGALGTVLEALSYRNITGRTCTTYGYPGITVYSRGRKLAVATREPHTVPPLLQVRPGQRVYGVVAYSETSSGRRPCPTVTSLGVYAPNSTRYVRVHLRVGGGYCDRGAFVYPLASSPQHSVDSDH